MVVNTSTNKNSYIDMKKIYLKPAVAVHNLRVELQPLMQSQSEQQVYEITTNPMIKGSGNGFWQAPEDHGVIDDEYDD